MPIPRPEELQGPRHGTVQPMVKFCPACRGDLEVLTSRRQEEFPHSYWCSVCGRVFEINYLGREQNLDDDWIDAAMQEHQ